MSSKSKSTKKSPPPQIATHAQQSVTYTVYDVKWIPKSSRFVVMGSHARGTGAIEIFDLNQGKLELMSKTERNQAIKCGTFAASPFEERHLAVGDFEGKVALWDLERMDVPVWQVKGHDSLINAIDGCGGLSMNNGSAEIATASKDGKIKIWDFRIKNPVATLKQPENQINDCWAVAFGNSNDESHRFVCGGYDNGDMRMFDLSMVSSSENNQLTKCVWETTMPKGICSLEFDRKDIEMNKMTATMLDSQFAVFDLRTKHSKKGYSKLVEKAHDSTVWCARHLPQNRDVWATTGGDGSINLYKYSYPKERSKVDTDTNEAVGIMGCNVLLASENISTQPVLSYDWNLEFEGLGVAGCLDQSVKIVLVTRTKHL